MAVSQEEFYRKLGERIRFFRSEIRDISQADFADRVELSRPSIVNIEKGRQQLSSYQLIIFAFALGVSPIELLGVDLKTETEVPNSKIESSLVPDHFQDWYQNVQ